MIESTPALTALIAAATALAFWLDHRFRAASKLGASLLAILFGALLSNFDLVPRASPVYDAVYGPVTSLAIAWLLLAVHLGDLRHAGARMLAAFGIAVIGTAAGAITGAFLFHATLGDQTWRLAGTLTGTYTGGSLNFVAVGRGLELPETLFAGATAADNLTTALWLGATLLLPVWLRRFYPTPVPAQSETHGVAPPGDARTADARTADARTAEDHTRAHHPFFAPAAVSTLQLSLLIAVGLLLVIAADRVGARTGIPAVLWLTTFALIVGHATPLARAPGALQLGTLALHFFFVVIGIGSRIADIVAVGVEVFFFTLVVVGIHGLIVFGIGRLARLDVGSIAVASQAAIGGPSSAIAVAAAREWPALLLPGVIVGLFGYAIGTYLGLGVAYLMRALLDAA